MSQPPESTPPAISFVKPPIQGEHPGVKIGEWNHAELAIGKRGYGKSTRLLERMEELNEEAGGAYKIGHSPEPRFPPDTIGIQIRYHEKLSSLDSWLRRRPEDFHCLISEEADPIVEYAKDLGKAIKRRSLGFWNRRGTALGKKAVPVILVIDEMMMLTGAKGSAQGSKSTDWFRRFLISLRHYHIAFLGGVQDSNSVSYVNASLATKLWCFRTTHEWALNSMRAAGLPPDQLAKLPKLGVGEYLEVNV